AGSGSDLTCRAHEARLGFYLHVGFRESAACPAVDRLLQPLTHGGSVFDAPDGALGWRRLDRGGWVANRQKSRDGFPWTDVLIVGVIAMATAAFVGGGIGWSLGGGTDRFIAEQAREVEAQAARVIPGAKPHRPAASRRRFSTSHL